MSYLNFPTPSSKLLRRFIRSKTRVGKRITTLLLTLVTITSAVVDSSIKRASALGPGATCFFLAPLGASGFGHIGWGYQVSGTSTWAYGATENNGGSVFVPRGGNTGYWQHNGNFRQMLAEFSGNNGNHQAGYYTVYRCTPVNNSAVGAANQAAINTQIGGYQVPNNDCLTHALSIAKTYGADIDHIYPYKRDTAGRIVSGFSDSPTDYFYALRGGWGATFSLPK